MYIGMALLSFFNAWYSPDDHWQVDLGTVQYSHIWSLHTSIHVHRNIGCTPPDVLSICLSISILPTIIDAIGVLLKATTTVLIVYRLARLPIICIHHPSNFEMISPSILFLPLSTASCATETGMSFFSLGLRRPPSKSSRHNVLWPRTKTRPIYRMLSSLALMHTIPSQVFLTSCQSSQHSSQVYPKTVRSKSQFTVGRSHVPVSRLSPIWNQRTFCCSRHGSSLMGSLLRE